MPPKLELPSLPIVDLLGFRRITVVRHGLQDLQQHINFEEFRPKLDELCHYSEKGRPHYDVVKMFRILILQTLYDLSDEDMEFNLCDRLSFQKFVGIGVMDDVPDARTIWKFRQRLGSSGVRELFKEFDRMMREKGLSYGKGTAVDASFQEAKRQRNSKEENADIKETGKAPQEWSAKKTAHKDVEATWTKKGNEKHFGYKNHAAVDLKTKMIRDYKVTTAKTHDSQVCEDIIPEGTKAVYADSAYMGKEREETLQKRHIKAYFVKRATRHKKLSEKEQKRNHRLAHTRARVEHVFGAIKQFYGDTVRYIGLERCGVRVGLVNLLYNMKRFCILQKAEALYPVA